MTTRVKRTSKLAVTALGLVVALALQGCGIIDGPGPTPNPIEHYKTSIPVINSDGYIVFTLSLEQEITESGGQVMMKLTNVTTVACFYVTYYKASLTPASGFGGVIREGTVGSYLYPGNSVVLDSFSYRPRVDLSGITATTYTDACSTR
jgi:hypothetical protein